ncbi:hypothetical protein C7I85_13435 [Mesorhizobium soli]|uniref:Uncharacterized protein n=1 Tax=Pseudaminobacter soli (ex Li et al. 2025) TaxID=1295366 RepID=A0A2P7SCI2_9HYPH|nr:hypothetical protein C7I85_13435 [Mesorhizobium soli]
MPELCRQKFRGAIAFEFIPLSVRFAATSPPFHGGEEPKFCDAATSASAGSSPPQSGGEVAAKRTERGKQH